MMCPRCNAHIGEGLAFCLQCGLPVSQNLRQTPGASATVPLPSAKPRPRRRLIGAWIGVVAFALLVAGAAVAWWRAEKGPGTHQVVPAPVTATVATPARPLAPTAAPLVQPIALPGAPPAEPQQGIARSVPAGPHGRSARGAEPPSASQSPPPGSAPGQAPPAAQERPEGEGPGQEPPEGQGKPVPPAGEQHAGPPPEHHGEGPPPGWGEPDKPRRRRQDGPPAGEHQKETGPPGPEEGPPGEAKDSKSHAPAPASAGPASQPGASGPPGNPDASHGRGRGRGHGEGAGERGEKSVRERN
jgi:hypothetical protein